MSQGVDLRQVQMGRAQQQMQAIKEVEMLAFQLLLAKLSNDKEIPWTDDQFAAWSKRCISAAKIFKTEMFNDLKAAHESAESDSSLDIG